MEREPHKRITKEDLGSIPGHVIPKTLKMVLDTSLLNTQQYKVSRVKWSNPGKGVKPYPTPRFLIAIENGAFWSPSTTVANFTYNDQYRCGLPV